MERILIMLDNPLVWFGFGAVVLLVFRGKQLTGLIYYLLAAIEVYDKKIKDVIPPEWEVKIGRIKRIISRTLTAGQKKKVDNLLCKMKVKGGQEYLHTDKLAVEDGEVEEVKNLCKVKAKDLI